MPPFAETGSHKLARLGEQADPVANGTIPPAPVLGTSRQHGAIGLENPPETDLPPVRSS